MKIDSTIPNTRLQNEGARCNAITVTVTALISALNFLKNRFQNLPSFECRRYEKRPYGKSKIATCHEDKGCQEKGVKTFASITRTKNTN